MMLWKATGTAEPRPVLMALVAQSSRINKIFDDYKSSDHNDTWKSHLVYETQRNHLDVIFQMSPSLELLIEILQQ